MSDHNTIDIAVLKNDVASIKKTIENYEKNHFPTINSKLERMEEKHDDLRVMVAYWTGGATALLAVLQIALKFLF